MIVEFAIFTFQLQKNPIKYYCLIKGKCWCLSTVHTCEWRDLSLSVCPPEKVLQRHFDLGQLMQIHNPELKTKTSIRLLCLPKPSNLLIFFVCAKIKCQKSKRLLSEATYKWGTIQATADQEKLCRKHALTQVPQACRCMKSHVTVMCSRI